jgi:hypothetical protein
MRLPLQRTITETAKSILIKRSLQRQLATSNWMFSKLRRDMLLNESSEWRNVYLPIDLRDKTVIDIGAGEGETAWFFLNHGAKHVICVEPSLKAGAFLKENAKRHNGKISVINDVFRLEHLELQFDFLKMDIEGYEEVLLMERLRVPSVIEVHGLALRDKFRQRGYRIVDSQEEYSCTAYAYWLC